MDKPDKFDLLIQEVIKEEMDSIVVPDMEEEWDKISKALEKRRRLTFIKRITNVAIITLIFTATLINTDYGYGYYRRILNFFSGTIGTNKEIRLDYNKNATIESDEGEAGLMNIETATIEETRQESSFEILVPSYMPKGYSMEKATLTQFANQTLMVDLIYSDENNNILKITQEPVLGDYSHTLQADSEDSIISQEIIEEISYNIIEFKHGDIMIIWDMSEIKYTVIGLNKEELMKVVLSIK